MIPGELLPAEGNVELNAGSDTATVTVANTGDRPVQVGSHFHFFETNRALRFDRKSAYGMRLNIPRRHHRALRAGRRACGRAGRHRRTSRRARPERPRGRCLDDPEVREAALRRACERGFMEEAV